MTLDIFEIEPADREQRYRELRDELSRDYSTHVGSTARRYARHQIAKQRGAGGYHARAADSQERRLENDIDDYDQGVRDKYVLAILTGRYDHALDELAVPDVQWSNTNPQHNKNVQRAAEIRIADLKMAEDE